MKKISTHFRQALLSLFFSVSIISVASAQCILQGSISNPSCGATVNTPNVGGMQEWSMSSTIGADYTVSISGSNGCGGYSASPGSFTATGTSTIVDILAGGACCWTAGGTSATLTYTRIGYTNTTSAATMCQGTTRSLTVSPAPFTAGTWSVIAGTGNGTISGTTFTATAAGTVTVRYTKGGCNSDVSFTIDAAPTTATVGGTQSICGLVSGGLGGNTPGVGTGTWSKISGPGTVTFSNANTGNATATVSAYGTYVLQWSIANGVCSPSTATVTVNYYQTPTTATVGATQDVCGTLTTGSLGGNTPAVGTGTWTQLSGPGTSTFSAVNSGSSTATASVPGTYVYTWTIANGVCPSSSANITVNYYASPTTATVGGTQNLCGTLTSANLGGNSPTVGTGAWSQTSGPGTTTFSNPASPSASATASVAGTYTYTWSISNGTCTPSTADVVVNFYAIPPAATVAAPSLNACGTLTSPALGGNVAAPGTGTWTQVSGIGSSTFSNVNSESSTATVTMPGTYVFKWTITNGNCPATSANVTVNYYDAPTTATVGPNQAVCSLTSGQLGGNAPGVGIGTWTQAAGPGVTFFSSVNSGSSTASVSVQGTYIFTWTIANGPCTSTANDTVNFYSNPTIATVGADQKLCGTLTSNALGGNTPAIGTGTWSQIAGPGTTTFSNVNAGSSTATVSAYGIYTYEWTISNGTCTPTTADMTVFFIPSPTGGTIANAAFCSAVGSTSISVTGVSNANQYSWALPAGLTGSSTTSNIGIGGTTPGTYTVTVTPSNVQFGVTCTGTPITGTVQILAQPVIDSVNMGSVSCYGGSDDTIRIYAHTSNGSLFYSVDNGLTFPNSTGVFPNQIAGAYNLQVRDDSTCTTSYSGNPALVTQPTALQVTIASYSNVRCSGDSTGFINIAVSGATPPYSFAWNNSATSQNIIDLGAGSYTVTVTDAKGCQQTLTQAIASPALITATATGTNISCYGANDGTASVTASGGVGTLTYTWSNGSSATSLTNLAAALYSVTIADGNGCQVVRAYTVTEPAPLRLTLSSSNVTCYGNGNGSIAANVTGGTGAYTYTWSPAVSAGPTVTNAGPGTYILTVTDANNCSAVDSVVITQPLSALSVSSIVTPVGCTGQANGAIQLLPSGGVGGYTYAWSTGQALQIISGLSANIYTATVTDGNGCQVIVSDTLTDPTPITSSVTGTSASCVGAGGGSATLTVSGGVAPYTFLWSDLETTQNISNLSGGVYRVIITDANGCQHNDSVVITQPQALVATFSVSNATCNGAANGSVTVNVTGGTGAGTYTYVWTPSGSISNSVSPASPGTYVVTVTDGNGCTLVDSAAVGQPQAISALVSVTNVKCFGDTTGSVTVSAFGGSGAYTYTWSPSVSTGATALNLDSGVYYVTVTDANGCSLQDSAVVSQPASPIIITSVVHNVTCNGGHDGSILVVASGGTGSYTYQWSTGDTIQYITNLAGNIASSSTLYHVTVTDASGCQASAVDTLRSPLPIITAITGTDVTCAGASNGSATMTVTGGRSPYTFFWSNATVYQNLSNVGGGTYTVIITDSLGCRAVDSVTISEPLPLVLSVTSTNVSCFGANDGTITATVTGGTGGYTYTWSPAVSTTGSVTNAAPGTYGLTVTDGNGCTATASVSITQPASAVALSTSVTDITCHDADNGAISTQVSGGSGAYTYAWTGVVATTPSVSGLAAGTYTVTVTDGSGCTATGTGTITNPADITSTTTGSSILCAGAANGTASVTTVSGGTGPYTYLWSNFAATQTISGLSGGLYRVVITDAHGCQHRDSAFVSEPQPLSLSLTFTSPGCAGGSNGTISAAVSGGTGAYTYTWSPAVSTGPTATNVAAGTYHLTVTDANGCSISDSVVVPQPAAVLTASVLVTDMTCHNADNGSITTLVSGGSGSYTYAWTGTAATTATISGLAAATYTVTVTDVGGCTATASGTINNPSDITSTTTGSSLLCAGAANGTASVTSVSGGTGSYTYLWSNFAATQSISGLGGGLYRVIITDANGCQHRDSAFVSEPQPLSLTLTFTSPGCAGGSNGSISAAVSGGTGAYTYTWSPAVSSGPTASNVGAGTYHLTVTDANGCAISDSVVILQPAAVLTASVLVTDITCHDADNGSITTLVSGGSGNYSYAWTGTAATTATITSLAAGSYTVTVTDLGGCTATATGTITNPSAITSAAAGTNVTCAGAANGTASVTSVSGGTGPYTYLWSNFAATQTISGLSGGVYRVVISDAHGCQHRDSVIITEPLPLVATLSVTQITCNGQNNGAITVATTGGTGTVAFVWTPGGQTTPTISNLSAGTYSVVGTDANGCTASASATIVNPGILTSASVVNNPTCNNGTGTVSLVVNGGTQPYSYNWSGALAGSGQSATNVSPGTYNVTITDAHGCTVVDSARVLAPAPIYISGIISGVSCHGNANGSVITTVYGGVQPYSYQWHYDSLAGAAGPITKDWLQLSGGEYYLAVTDINNCSASFHASIHEADSLKLTLTETNVTCYGLSNGTLQASPAGGTTPYHFLWNNFVTDSVQSGVSAGSYGVVVTDSNGCQQTKTITVSQPAALISHVTAVNPACSGQSSGTATVAVSGGSGTGTYTYAWSTTPAQSTATATGLSAGAYYVTVTDGNGCSLTDSTALTAPQALAVNTAISNPTCADGSNGFVSLDVRQGTAPYNYSWNTSPAQAGNVASGLTAGTYVATITDAAGCQLLDTAIVVAPAPITISLTGLGSSTCVNSADGFVVVSVTGGLAPYIYQVGTLTQSSDTFRNLTPGTYNLSVRDANTCEATTNWTISASSSFTVDLAVDHDVILAGETIQLTATPTSDTTVTGYTWITQDSSLNFSACGSAANCPNPTAVPQASYTYIVQAANARGCIASDTVRVTVSNQPSEFMPSAFTPNGDGNNDRFQMDILGAKDLHVQVWNRWGEKVYDNPTQKNGVDQSSSEGWDGFFRSKKVEFGTYIYQIDVNYLNGQKKTISGSITVMP